MRLAFIGPANSLHFWRRTNWFATHGHQVMILSYAWPAMPVYEPAVSLRTFDFEDGKDDPLAVLAWVRKHLKDFRPQVLHAHKLDYPGIFSLFAGFSPLVVTLWDGILVRDPRIRPGQRELVALAGQRADLITTNSPKLLEECFEQGVPVEKGRLTSWGVDSDVFHMDRSKSPSLRTHYALSPDDVVIFSPRVLTTFSNLDTLVQALDRIAAAEPRARLLIASYASTDDGLASFGRLLAESRHKERITFCGHIKDQRALADHYRLADAVVSLYSGYLESSPASIIEAMLCGAVPVVADHPVISFWVTDGIEGSVVRHRNSDAVAQGVIQALNMVRSNPALRKRNRAKVLAQANYHLTMPMVETAYKHIVEKVQPMLRFSTESVSHLTDTDKGLLHECLGRDRDARANYARAGDESRRINLEKWLALEGKFTDPFAAKATVSGDVSGLGPPPSGDAREYVRAVSLKTTADVDAVLGWLLVIARKFGYDQEFLQALAVLEAWPDGGQARDAARNLLARTQPRNILLTPIYEELSMTKGEDRTRWLKLAKASWLAQDMRFAGELKHIQPPESLL